MKIKRKIIIGVMTMAMALTLFGIVRCMPTVKAAEDEGVLMYRMYNPISGEHLYTKDNNEKDYLLSIKWNYEGYSWVASKEGEPVYRLFNSQSGEHHYTMDETERLWLLLGGWIDEGIGWYTESTGRECEAPVYRLFCPYTNEGPKAHHYTMDKGEREWLLFLGWIDEGICWNSMHDIKIDDTIIQPTCNHEGYSGGAVCEVCGKTYDGIILPKNEENHINTTFIPEEKEIIERNTGFGDCNIITCNECGEVIYITGDIIDDMEMTIASHFNANHGCHFITWLDVENGLATEEQYDEQDWDLWSNLWTSVYVPAYTDTVVLSPAHTHCDDCGNDIF